MLIYLFRHADADTPAPSDEQRSLTGKGFAQAKRMGKLCAGLGIEPEIILSSPLLRARQTAETFASCFQNSGVEIAAFLASGMDPETAFESLRPYRELESVLLVGHEPDISRFCAYLLGMEGGIHIRKASLTLIQLPVWRPGAGILEFSLPCRFFTTDC